MSERIRYKLVGDSFKESVQTFPHDTNGAKYKVAIDVSTWEWKIIEAGSNMVASSGKNIDAHKTQLEVRAALKALGIAVHTETRAKRKRV